VIYSGCHVIALVKGTIEGDPYMHFGSLLGMASHMSAAQRFGLLDANKTPTEAGYAFYREARLSEFPKGRANYWHASAADKLEAAERLLERRTER
jgi:hypothetical protein